MGQAARPALLRGRRRGGSFSAAARCAGRQRAGGDQLVSALERDLGVKLLDRGTQGLLRSRARGAQYLENCTPLLRRLADADRALVVLGRGAHALVAGRAAAASRARCWCRPWSGGTSGIPTCNIDLRTVDFTVRNTATRGVDVPDRAGLAGQRRPRSAAAGAEPSDHLRQPGLLAAALACPGGPPSWLNHVRSLVRDAEGTVLDLWRQHARWRRPMKWSWAAGPTCATPRRDVLQAVLLGAGRGRSLDLSVWSLRSRRPAAARQSWSTESSDRRRSARRFGPSRSAGRGRPDRELHSVWSCCNLSR